MSHGEPSWTRDQVAAWLVTAWRQDPRQRFEGRQPATLLAARDWPALYLPRREHGHLRDVVTAWAWCRGAREESFRTMCTRRGWKRGTALRDVERGLALIVDGLNQDAARAARARETFAGSGATPADVAPGAKAG